MFHIQQHVPYTTNIETNQVDVLINIYVYTYTQRQMITNPKNVNFVNLYHNDIFE